MMRRISLRRFSPEGSTAVDVAVEEAERIVEEALRRGALVLDDEKEEPIKGIAESTQSVLIVDPLQGGAH